jgi:hypothetical protein
MRFPIRAIVAFTIAIHSGCGVSEPIETSGFIQEIIQSCAVTADCSAFAADQCLSNQVGACVQASTASAHCACVTVPDPSHPIYPPPVPGRTCWQIRNDCVAACELGGSDCRNACDWEWGNCGF